MTKETIIVLDRTDLNPLHKNVPISDLTWTYFNISIRDLEEASIVLFYEDGEFNYFKNRYTGLTNI